MNIVHSFQELVVRGDHQGTIELLKNFEQSRKLSVHERGWVYWNISDGYALLREPEPLYANHREFFEWGEKPRPGAVTLDRFGFDTSVVVISRELL